MQSLLLQHTHHKAIGAWMNALDVAKEKIQAVAIKWPALNFDHVNHQMMGEHMNNHCYQCSFSLICDNNAIDKHKF